MPPLLPSTAFKLAATRLAHTSQPKCKWGEHTPALVTRVTPRLLLCHLPLPRAGKTRAASHAKASTKAAWGAGGGGKRTGAAAAETRDPREAREARESARAGAVGTPSGGVSGVSSSSNPPPPPSYPAPPLGAAAAAAAGAEVVGGDAPQPSGYVFAGNGMFRSEAPARRAASKQVRTALDLPAPSTPLEIGRAHV